jgi:hypothetical protein
MIGKSAVVGRRSKERGRDHLVTGGGIIQESLGAIIPL